MGAEADRLGSDLASPEFAHGVEQGFWELVSREQDVVSILLHAPDGRDFLARMECSDYWTGPIGCQFVDPSDGQVKAAAWPDGNGDFAQWVKFSGPPHFICWHQDRFAFQHHQEWKVLKEWQGKPSQIVAYLDFLRRMLHIPARGYNRRKSSTVAS